MTTATAEQIIDHTAPRTDEAAPRPPLALVKASPYAQLTEFVRHLDELKQVAEYMCKSTLLPREMQTPANLQMVLAQGLEMGFTVVQAIRASFIITSKNAPPKVGYYVESLVALVRKSTVCRFFRVEVCTADKCRVVCARKDEDESVVHVFEITMVEAQKANLDKKWEWDEAANKLVAKQKYPWITAPSDMLRNRTSGRAVKSVFQDVIFGMATPDELDDVADANVIEMMESGPNRFSPVPVAAKSSAPADPAPTHASSAPAATVPKVAENGTVIETTATERMDTSSGNPGWDSMLGKLSQLEEMRTTSVVGWFPNDLMEEWERRLAKCLTRGELNALSPWIGIVAQGASKSKDCAELANRMKVSFNEATTELRKREAKS